MSGEELTRLGDEHSDLLSGLVYMAAIADPTDFPASSKEYMEIAHKLPVAMQPGPPPTAADRSSVEAASGWLENRVHVRFPLGEVYNANVINSDGTVGDFADEARIHTLIGQGAQKRDYTRITVPILAFIDSDCPARPQPDLVCIQQQKAEYQPKNDQERQAIDAFWSATDVYENRWIDTVRKAHAPVRFIDLPRSNHYVFLSDTSIVLREAAILLEDV